MRQRTTPALDKPLPGYWIYYARRNKTCGVFPVLVENRHALTAAKKLNRQTGASYSLPDDYEIYIAHELK